MKKIIPLTRIKAIRVEKGLGQQDLADKVGVARSTIAGIERGDNPASLFLAQEMGRVLNVPWDKLFKAHNVLKGRFVAKEY